MAAVQERTDDAPPLNIFWWLTLGYAALACLGWLTVGMQRFLYWQRIMAQVAATRAQGDVELAGRGEAFAGSLVVDMVFAFGAAAVFAFAAIALSRRSWNAWDYATVAAGALTVLTGIYLCAYPRLMFFIPPTAGVLWALLYLPWTKSASGVGRVVEPAVAPDAPVTTLSRDEIEREIARERTLIAQLAQNLDVFEVERSISTDLFVQRYTNGLEEENADNAEWFSIARAVRRSRERLAALTAQLETMSDRQG